jgi:acyl dehydratase
LKSASGLALRQFDGVHLLADQLGVEIACSAWLAVESARVSQFADATGDHQWIHVDEQRARRESPFGAPVAHGFLTLSLIPGWLAECVAIRQRMGVNYGLNRVRFPAPVPVGSRLRARFVVQAFEALEGGAQITWAITIEQEGGDKPVCVAELITRHYD